MCLVIYDLWLSKCYMDLDITFFKSLDVSSHSASKSHCAKINSNTCSSTILPFSRAYIVDKVSDAERKARVDAIHRLKERLKELSDTQKSLKLSLQDVTERLRSEREEASSSALATRGSLTMSWMIEVLNVIDWCRVSSTSGHKSNDNCKCDLFIDWSVPIYAKNGAQSQAHVFFLSSLHYLCFLEQSSAYQQFQ